MRSNGGPGIYLCLGMYLIESQGLSSSISWYTVVLGYRSFLICPAEGRSTLNKHLIKILWILQLDRICAVPKALMFRTNRVDRAPIAQLIMYPGAEHKLFLCAVEAAHSRRVDVTCS